MQDYSPSFYSFGNIVGVNRITYWSRCGIPAP